MGDNAVAGSTQAATVAEVPAGRVEAPEIETTTKPIQTQTAPAAGVQNGSTSAKSRHKTVQDDIDSEEIDYSDISSQESHGSPALSEAETLLQLAAGTPANAAARKREHASSSAARGSKRQRAAAASIAAVVAAAAAVESAEEDTDTDLGAAEAVAATADAAGALEPQQTGRKGYPLEDLPDGRKKVNMSFCLSKSSTFKIPVIPRELAVACFPEPCNAQLSFVMDDKPVEEEDEPVVVRVVRCEQTVYGRPRVTYQMKGANALYERYSGCTVTGMSAAASTHHTNRCKLLTVYLRSPAATALAQYAAAAAEAALDCCSTWHTHKLQASERRRIVHNGKDVRIHVPGALIRAAYPGPPQLPFRVQVSMVKDGQKTGSAGLRGSTVTKKRQLNLPAKLLRVVDGCVITRLRAAAPNFLQVHVRSDPDDSEAASDSDTAEQQPAKANAATVGTWHKHEFEAAQRRFINGDTKEIRQHVPGSLIEAAYGTPELPFKVQLSLHRDGKKLGPVHDYAHATISNKRQLHIPFKWLRSVEGCTLSHLSARAPNHLQIHVLSSGVSEAAEPDVGTGADRQAATETEGAPVEANLPQQRMTRQGGSAGAVAAATQQLGGRTGAAAAAAVVGAATAQHVPIAAVYSVVERGGSTQQGAGQVDCSEAVVAPAVISHQQQRLRAQGQQHLLLFNQQQQQQQLLLAQRQQRLLFNQQQQHAMPQELQPQHQRFLAPGQQRLLLFNQQQQAVPQQLQEQQQQGVMQQVKPARLGQLRGRLMHPHAAAAKPMLLSQSSGA